MNPDEVGIFQPQLTGDGSSTFFSPDFEEAFHSHYGAKAEAEGKFVLPCQLAAKARAAKSLSLLDICYGLGYNSAAAIATIWESNPDCKIELIALELNPLVPQAAITHQLLHNWDTPISQLLTQLATRQYVDTQRLEAKLWLGDARQVIGQLTQSSWQADAIFLDPFSPPKCPQLWSVEFLALVAQCLKPHGRLATYSCAAGVRTALKLSGLAIGASTRVGRRSPGTVASFMTAELAPLSQQELEHLQTRAAVPYRDPQLTDTTKIILQRRTREQESSSLEPTSQWKKRWFNKTQPN